jgi:hypothetical protein
MTLQVHRGQSDRHPGERPFSGIVRVCRLPTLLLVTILFCLLSNIALNAYKAPADATDGEHAVRSLVAGVNPIVISPSRVYVGEPMTFYVNASSTVPTATINVTVYFDYLLSDGVTVNPYSPVFSTEVVGMMANVTTVYTYDHIGNLTFDGSTYFRVRAVVNDGDTSSEKTARAFVVDNSAPWLYSKPEPTILSDYNESKNLSFVVCDWDSEMVTATWDFGDGTDLAVNETIATPTGSRIWQNHTWVVDLEPGRDASIDSPTPYYIVFNMTVSFVDSVGHMIYSNHTVNITPPANDGPSINFIAASSDWSPGYELPLFANVTDSEGDPITWTFVFNNSVEDYLTEVYHTNQTDPETVVSKNITHTFYSIGVYYVTLYVSDALPPYQTWYHNISQTIQITIIDNKAPGVLANISVTPINPKINSTLGYAEVKFSIQARDSDGDILYLSWDFGDGETGGNTSLGGTLVFTFVQVHRYTVAGIYNVSVVVEDMRGHTVLRYKAISVYTNNTGPKLVLLDLEMSNGVFAIPGSTINVTVTLSDAERDPLILWINFGDNSSVIRVNLSDYSSNNTVTVLIAHVYNAVGEYNITFTYTDGLFGPSHNVTIKLSVEVKVPRVIVIRIWNWWDSTSLFLLSLGVALVLARWYLIGRFRKELDRKGTTFEEYRIIAKDLKKRRNARLKEVAAQMKDGRMDSARASAMKSEIRDGYKKNRKSLRAGTWTQVEEGM